ncbi:hypothetical protein, partial [Nocardiopsis nanhaiensis]
MKESLAEIWSVITTLLALAAPIVTPWWWVVPLGAAVLALGRVLVLLRHVAWSRNARLIEV